MKYRTFPNTDLSVSAVGLGCRQIGGKHWGFVEDNQSEATIRTAVDFGINFFDTAPAYGFGHSEMLLGRAVRGIREKVIIATKFGLEFDSRGAVRHNNQPKNITRELEASLKRLGTDYVDLYQIHWPDPGTPLEETWQHLIRLKASGKVRHIGVCNLKTDDLAALNQLEAPASFQSPYNLLETPDPPDWQSHCADNGPGVIAYSPLCRGLLGGKYGSDLRLSKKDLRRRDPAFGEKLADYLTILDALRDAFAANGPALPQLATAWCLANPAVVTAIPGARTPEQIRELALAAETDITVEMLGLLAGIRRRFPV